jgi:hypothetical protein
MNKCQNKAKRKQHFVNRMKGSESQDLSISKLPYAIREKLQDLELEYRDGDLTQQGYEKKKKKILAELEK